MSDANIRAVITAKDEASNVLKKFGDTTSNVAKTAALGIAAAAAAAVAFGYSSVKAYENSQNQLAQLNAVLKSTAGVAGVTSEAAIKLSESLQKTTKFSDEEVLSAENLLLTFTKIGKDIFPQATKTVLNMATALGEDTKSASIQLGKALQDPILGITALRRVGVNFSDAQKKVIEGLVNTGKQAEAQKLILKELETEFGGSAEAAGGTFAGSLAKLKNSFDDIQESIGKTIVDAITPLAQKLADFVNSDGFKRWLDELIRKMNEELPRVINWVTNTGLPFLKQAFDQLWPVVQTLWNWFSTLIKYMTDNQWVFWAVVTVFGAIKGAMLLSGALEAFQNVIAGAKLAYMGLQALVGTPMTIAIIIAPALLAIAYLMQKAAELKSALASAEDSFKQNQQSAGRLEKDQWQRMADNPANSAAVRARASAKVADLTSQGYASGTDFAPGGMALVGERGPELVNLPRGSQVIPNDKIGSAGGGQPINVTFNGVFTGNEMEFRKLAIKVFQAASDVADMKNNEITGMTTQDWRRA